MYSKVTDDHTTPLVEFILNDLARRFKVPIGIYQMDGNTIFSKEAGKYFSPLCSAFARIPEIKRLCDKDHNRRGQNTDYAMVEMCHCGLFNFGMPIFLKEGKKQIKVGTLLCGQKRIKDQEQARESQERFFSFLNKHKKLLKKREKYIKKYNYVDIVDADSFDALQEELSRAAELIFKVFFERKIINQRRSELEKNINTIAHEIQIYVQGAFGAVNEIEYNCQEQDIQTILTINKNLEGMLNHIGSIVTNLVWSSTNLVYSFEELNILHMLQEAVDYYRWFAKNRQIDLRLKIGQGSPKIIASEPHVKQVINNLIHNAIKYSFKGNIAKQRFRYVTIEAKSEANEYYVVKFKNYGIGILEQEYDKILKEQYRGLLIKNEKRAGTGLGLRIVKDIIDRHKGKINIKSIPTEGKAFLNIFEIKFPYRH